MGLFICWWIMSEDKGSLWREDLKKPWELARCASAELLGTTLFMWFVTATCAEFPGNGSTLQTALTVGFIVATLVQALAHVGGCHINPAVTMAFGIVGRDISWVRSLIYINCQFVGAVAGTAFYELTTPEALRGVGLCATRVDEAKGVTWWQALIVEVVLTHLLVLVVLAVSDERRPCPGGSGSFIIGLALVANFLMGIQYSGASMNAARTLGPAVLSGYTVYYWMYMAATTVGGVTAALFWKYVLMPPTPA